MDSNVLNEWWVRADRWREIEDQFSLDEKLELNSAMWGFMSFPKGFVLLPAKISDTLKEKLRTLYNDKGRTLRVVEEIGSGESEGTDQGTAGTPEEIERAS